MGSKATRRHCHCSHKPPRCPGQSIAAPSRFDRQVYVSLPNIEDRSKFSKYIRKVLDEAIELNVLARGTPGFSGADLAIWSTSGAFLRSPTDD